ncbi:unnamed protein product [Symbiodinium microadriaticum]|nr:unnamed protein product [Symbiodinium microadriaticum]
MKFQQFWEQKCFGAGGATYSVPAQRAVDYIRQHESGRDFRFPRAATAAESQLQTRRRRELRDQGSTREVSHDLPDHIFMGSLRQSNLHDCLPDYVNSTLVKALMRFATAMPGLLTEDSLLMGIESRTSSPVRICRDSQTLESVNTKGLYPLGEGAGYAGGIMTACVDGVRAVEAMVLSTDPSHAGNYFQQQYKGDDCDNYPAW